MLILGFDFETSGRDPEIHRITEVGMVTWDTDLRQPVKSMGYPVNPGPDTIWEPDLLEENPGGPEFCAKYGLDDLRAAKQFFLWLQAAETTCSHNGLKFDKKFARNWAARYNFEFDDEKKLWIDTMVDLPLPKKYSRKLPYMPIDHRLYPNPFPHRAVFDAVSMMTLFSQYPIDRVLGLARSPMMVVKALVVYANNQLARDQKYYAEYKDGKFVMWRKEMKELFIPEERERCRAAGFEIEVIGKYNV